MATKKIRIKTGGRIAGTPNRTTADLRAVVKNLLEDNVEKVKSDFEALEPKDRIVMFERLLQYCIPRKREEEKVEESEQERLIRKFFETG